MVIVACQNKECAKISSTLDKFKVTRRFLAATLKLNTTRKYSIGGHI
jgi:hypothetical protein